MMWAGWPDHPGYLFCVTEYRRMPQANRPARAIAIAAAEESRRRLFAIDLTGPHVRVDPPTGWYARGLVQVERIVEVAGELYRVRGITSSRNRQVPVIEVYCEARFYDLGTAGQVDAVELSGVQPGTAIAIALQSTGWTIGRVNVTTTRTYSIEEGSPLAVLRQIAKVHGGDLVFDNTARTVSLLTFAGRRDGRTFIYGHDATDAKRVEDTTTLVTRIYARNADGMTIADVNGAKVAARALASAWLRSRGTRR